MNKVLSYSICILIFICSISAYSQENKQLTTIFQKVSEAYTNPERISLNFSYKLYTTYKSPIVSEQYIGYYFKTKTESYMKIHNTEFMQAKGISLKVNHDQKAMLVGKNSAEIAAATPTNISGYLKYFKTKNLSSDGNNWICTLETSLYTQLPYGKIVVYVNKRTYKIEKQILYLLDKASYKNKNGIIKQDYPRLEITISDRNSFDVFNINTFITMHGQNYLPSKKYSNYKLLKS